MIYKDKVLNSISSNLDYIHNKEGSNVAIATYDHKSVQFYSLDKSGEVKVWFYNIGLYYARYRKSFLSSSNGKNLL